MVFEKNTLKELLREKNISDTKGLQELMREMYKEVIEGLMEGEAHLVMSSILCKLFLPILQIRQQSLFIKRQQFGHNRTPFIHL